MTQNEHKLGQKYLIESLHIEKAPSTLNYSLEEVELIMQSEANLKVKKNVIKWYYITSHDAREKC